MRRHILLLALIFGAAGCERWLVQTREQFAGLLAPVNPNAGPVRPVIVQGGGSPLRVAIVDVDGLLLNTPFVGPMSVGENPVALFREKLQAAACDSNVKAVVLRINSPGGGVAACLAMRADLLDFKARTHLPVVSCLLDQATGGAYVLAAASDLIVAEPADVTGGLGVIFNLYNLQDLMAQFNIIPRTIISGKYTDMGSCARALEPEEKEMLQKIADNFHALIEKNVLQTRPQIGLAGGAAFDGRIFSGQEALSARLVDQVATLDDAINAAAQLGCPGLAPNVRPQVVLYRRLNDPATTIYSVTANVPLQGSGLLPSLPGLDRSRLPTFMSIWQPELTIEKLAGK
jgi:protease-4